MLWQGKTSCQPSYKSKIAFDAPIIHDFAFVDITIVTYISFMYSMMKTDPGLSSSTKCSPSQKFHNLRLQCIADHRPYSIISSSLSILSPSHPCRYLSVKCSPQSSIVGNRGVETPIKQGIASISSTELPLSLL
jgi:hypothetical protein